MDQVVLLIRHGKTDHRQDVLAAWTPGVHLGDEGRREVEALAERLADVRFVGAYTSPLERCRETAEAVLRSRRVSPTVEDGLGEVRFGDWQGRTYKSLRRTKLWRTVQYLPSEATFPGGESIRELQRRGVEAVERIRGRHRRGVIAAFSHADTIKAVTASYLGLHLDLFQRIVVPTASVTAIGFGDEFPRVLCMGDTGRYGDLAMMSRPRRRR